MADSLPEAWYRYVVATAELRRDVRDWLVFVASDPHGVDLVEVTRVTRRLVGQLRHVQDQLAEVQRVLPQVAGDLSAILRLRLTTVDAYVAVAIHELERYIRGEVTTPGGEWLANLDIAIVDSLAAHRALVAPDINPPVH
jgi:hypothetical protein